MKNIITEQLILLDVELIDKAMVISQIAELLEIDDRLIDSVSYIDDVFSREEIVPTGIGDLIAIPHARSKAVSASSLVFIRLAKPIMWSEQEDAQFIFGIAVPEHNADNLHLKILSMVARKLLDDKIKKIIQDSPSKQQILEALLITPEDD